MQVMPYSTGLSTPLANFEANQNYKDTMDPSVMVGTTSWSSAPAKVLALEACTASEMVLCCTGGLLNRE